MIKDSSLFLILREYKKDIAFFVISCIVLCGLLTLNYQDLYPAGSTERVVLSSMAFSLRDKPNERYQVLKIKNNNKIFVEVYSVSGDGNYDLMSRIDTKNKYDGFFLLGGNATNLAYMNGGSENLAQILVPGFDQNLTAYLNVIRFDAATKTFTLLTDIPQL